MNQTTLERIRKNPHYKPSAKQKVEIANNDPEHMISFGVIPKNSNGFQVHNPKVPRTGQDE